VPNGIRIDAVLELPWHDSRYMRMISLVQQNFDPMQTNAAALRRISERCLIFKPKYSILPRVSQYQLGLSNVLCLSRSNTAQDTCWEFAEATEYLWYASNFWSIATNQWVRVSYSNTTAQYRLAWVAYGVWPWVTRLRPDAKNSAEYLMVVELCSFNESTS
jgi:hypothetical protein